jgi:hypothetical protein
MPWRFEKATPGPLQIWEWPEPGKAYGAGIDTAGGKNDGDWATISVTNFATGSLAAFFRAHMEPTQLAHTAFLLSEFFGQHTKIGHIPLTPERNSHGIATIDELRHLGHPMIYLQKVWDRTTGLQMEQLGFTTSERSRPMLIKRGRDALNDPNCDIPCKIILEEASTFVRDQSGREEAMPGKFDDGLMSWLLSLEGGHYFYILGKGNPLPEAQESPEQQKGRRVQQQIMNQISRQSRLGAQRRVHVRARKR